MGSLLSFSVGRVLLGSIIGRPWTETTSPDIVDGGFVSVGETVDGDHFPLLGDIIITFFECLDDDLFGSTTILDVYTVSVSGFMAVVSFVLDGDLMSVILPWWWVCMCRSEINNCECIPLSIRDDVD